MDESSRKSRQVFIALIFFLIVGGVAFGLYKKFLPPAPAPTPNPTINLVPISVVPSKLFNVENNDYDFLAKVYNANTDYGSADVEYELDFYGVPAADGASDRLVSQRTGSFYILPGQTKYVIESPLKFQEPISRVEFKVKSVDWQKLDQIAATGVMLLVKNASYSQVSELGVFAKVGGEVVNNSDFDLNKVSVLTVALDKSDEPIAVNKTDIRTFLAHTTRGFEVTWFSSFVGQVGRIDAEAETNVFENSNFLRQYGGQEKFKQLY